MRLPTIQSNGRIKCLKLKATVGLFTGHTTTNLIVNQRIKSVTLPTFLIVDSEKWKAGAFVMVNF